VVCGSLCPGKEEGEVADLAQLREAQFHHPGAGSQPRVSLFIADDNGLGKTIEAGLIARELLLRKKAKTTVVAAPPSVLEQWKEVRNTGR